MKRLLNTLYITTEGAALRKEGETVVVEIDGQQKTRVPLHLLGSLVVFGAVLLTPSLLQTCAADPTGMEIARSMVMGKLVNQRAVLTRALRDHSETMEQADSQAISDAGSHIVALLKGPVKTCDTLDGLRGLEGDAARVYFGAFNALIRSPDTQIRFIGRSRRPPLDPVNAVLSFLYTLLVHDCRSALEAVGLDPAVGFLHRDRPGRPSLALDLMEELRPVLADRLALSLFNRRQLRATDFKTQDNGSVLLTDDARKAVLVAWQERKRDERQHPFLGEGAPMGLVPHLQALLLARHLRGDIDGYPPWFWS